MTVEKSILFVCTGNTFRSFSAERCFKQYLLEHNIDGWKVGSAGIVANPSTVDPKIIQTLMSLGIADTPHIQTKVTLEVLNEYDVVVAMAQNHLDFLKSEFDYQRALLFNALAEGKDTSVWDIDELPDYLTNRSAVEDRLERTVKEIHAKIPELYKNVSEQFYPAD